MSEGTTKPNGGSKKEEIKKVYESPEEIEKRISDAGYGNLTVRRVVSAHAIQFEVSDDREKVASEEEKKDFMRVGNPKKKIFNPVELAREAMVGKLGKLKTKRRAKEESIKKDEEKDVKETSRDEKDDRI